MSISINESQHTNCEGFGAAVAQAESVGRANIRRIKSQSRTQSTLNNVRELKAKLDLEHDCWIYDIADGSVVTNSTLRNQFAAKMYQTDSLLSECPLFIDGCEKTLNENCTEIKLVLYHPVLHKVWIAKYKAPGLTGSSQAVEHLLKCVSAMCYAKHQMPFKPIHRVISPTVLIQGHSLQKNSKRHLDMCDHLQLESVISCCRLKSTRMSSHLSFEIQ